ncbi:unnamed protein product [Ambrosiozyma monospora]|uniref:Unnamed protein product n=1 Tax=Ambrosiozyma monospora TaxID=43982 RepID=A0ACB5T2L8_AMBMO|nr:unnamed protein product [Ambrosiozyma monospora]
MKTTLPRIETLIAEPENRYQHTSLGIELNTASSTDQIINGDYRQLSETLINLKDASFYKIPRCAISLLKKKFPEIGNVEAKSDDFEESIVQNLKAEGGDTLGEFCYYWRGKSRIFVKVAAVYEISKGDQVERVLHGFKLQTHQSQTMKFADGKVTAEYLDSFATDVFVAKSDFATNLRRIRLFNFKFIKMGDRNIVYCTHPVFEDLIDDITFSE